MIIKDLKIFIDITELVEKQKAIFLPENFSWAKNIASSLPKINLDLPTIKKQAKIDIIMDKRNPIYVQLSDGSKLFFTHDEFKRIDGKPECGKTMVVFMQRLPYDNSESASKITHCKVI
jgi:hypothetical protein